MIEIRKVEISQIEHLREISIETFKQSFSLIYDAYSIETYLHNSFSIKKLQEEYKDPNSEFYFLYVDNELIGYIKINYQKNHLLAKDKNASELQRIYLRQKFIGKGHGQYMLNFAIDKAKEKECKYIWLITGEENVPAIGFYLKNQFKKIDEQYLDLGNSKVKSVVMQYSLNNDSTA